MIPIDAQKQNKIVTGAIIVGTILYLSKFLRPYFTSNDSTLFFLGFLPNLGLAFAVPFIYVGNRTRLNKPVKHFTISSIVTLLLMVLNETRDKYESGRVFDWYDIFASCSGVLFAFVLFHITLRKENVQIIEE